MSLEVPFRLRGVDGVVRVSLLRNEDPERWGWRLLGLDVPLEYIVGFPVIEASVDYPAEGYAAVMGWVQVVRYEATDEPETVVLADVAPQLQGLGMPYVAFGVRPTYFDSPAISAPGADWRASTFLTASPDVLLSRVIEPVCGFCWGYRRKDGVTELVEATRAEEKDWLEAREELVTRYSDWEWRESWATGS
ncbi:MAG TPA: hypothetical protein VGJ40_00445 [Gaiellaceae bacterium]